MKKKGIWVLVTLVLLEIIALGFFFLKPTQSTQKTKDTTENKTSLTTNESTSTSEKEVDKQIKWIESDQEIAFPILMYHSLAESEGNSLKVPPREFKEHMTWLKENDYYFLTPDEAYTVLTENKKPAEKIVWVTFDDGYLNNYTEGFPILKELEVHATINYITSKLGSEYYFNLEQMKEMAASGWVNIESHTVSHLDLNTLEDSHIDSELKDSKDWIDKELRQNTTLLCYPAGRYDERVIASSDKNGYKMAVTTEPGYAQKSNGLQTLKRVRISPGYDGPSFGAFVEGSKP